MLSIALLLFPLLFILPFLTSSTVLTLTLPSSLQALPCSSHATLTTHGLTLSAPVTRANTFVFTNLTTLNTYLLEIWSVAWEFDHGLVVLKNAPSMSASDFLELEVYKLKAGLGGRRIRVLPSPDGQQTDGEVAVPWAVKGPRNYYESRPSFSPLTFFKSPMILLSLGGLALVIGMPYLMENMDPEMRKEFEEQQRKSVLNSAAAGGGNPFGNFDMAGWVARQTQTQTQQTSGREREGEGEMEKKVRRRG